MKRFPGGHSFFLDPGEGQQEWVSCIKSTLVNVIDEERRIRDTRPGGSVQSEPILHPEGEHETEPEPAQERQTKAPQAAGVMGTQHWCVIANHGRNPIAAQLVAKLRSCGRNVAEVNPYAGPITTLLALQPETRS